MVLTRHPLGGRAGRTLLISVGLFGVSAVVFGLSRSYLLSLLALDSALEVFDGVDLAALRAKSIALGELFIRLADATLEAYGFDLISPRDAEVRGSQVSLTHPQGYAIMQALIGRGIIGDFRAPDILRFGLAPLYVRFVDVFDTVDAIGSIMRDGEWNQPQHLSRKPVT